MVARQNFPRCSCACVCSDTPPLGSIVCSKYDSVIMSVLLLLKKQKVNGDYLIKESDRYQLSTTVRNLVNYIQTKVKAKPEYFPTWKEYGAKAKEYGL
jgi:hypothetical protein